jgi:hypothetical protein
LPNPIVAKANTLLRLLAATILAAEYACDQPNGSRQGINVNDGKGAEALAGWVSKKVEIADVKKSIEAKRFTCVYSKFRSK